MSILDLLMGLLAFHFITFGLYLAGALVCLDRRKQGQEIKEKQVNGHEKRQQTGAEITDKQSEKQAE